MVTGPCDTVQAEQIDNFCNAPDPPYVTDWGMSWYQVHDSDTSDKLQKIGVARLFQKHHLNTLCFCKHFHTLKQTAALHIFPIVVDTDC